MGGGGAGCCYQGTGVAVTQGHEWPDLEVGHIASLLRIGGISASGLQFQDGIAKHDGKGRGPGLEHGTAVRSQTKPGKTLSLFLSG